MSKKPLGQSPWLALALWLVPSVGVVASTNPLRGSDEFLAAFWIVFVWGAIVLGAYRGGNAARAGWDRARADVLRALGLAPDGPALVGRVGRIPIRIEPEGKRVRLTVTCEVPGIDLGPRGSGASDAVKTGEAAFDDQFSVRGDEVAVRCVFDDKARSLVRKLAGDLVDLEIRNGRLTGSLSFDQAADPGRMLERVASELVNRADDLRERATREKPMLELIRIARDDRDERVREKALALVARLAPENAEAREALDRGLDFADPRFRLAVVRALPYPHPRKEEVLISLLDDAATRLAAIDELAECGTVAAVAPLHALGLPKAQAAIEKIQARIPDAGRGQLSISSGGGELSEAAEPGRVSIAKKQDVSR